MFRKGISILLILILLISNINFVSASNNFPEKLNLPQNNKEIDESINYYISNIGRGKIIDSNVDYNKNCNLDDGKDLGYKISIIFSDFISSIIGSTEKGMLDDKNLEYTILGKFIKFLNELYFKDKVSDKILKTLNIDYNSDFSELDIKNIKDKFINDILVEELIEKTGYSKENKDKIKKILVIVFKEFSDKFLEESKKNKNLSFLESVNLFGNTLIDTIFSPYNKFLNGSFYENIQLITDISELSINLFLNKNDDKFIFLESIRNMFFKLIKLQFDCQEFFFQRIKENGIIEHNLPIINREFIYNLSLLYIINKKYNIDLGYGTYKDLNKGLTREEYINSEYRSHLNICISNIKGQANVIEKGGWKEGEYIRKIGGLFKGFFTGKNLKEQYIQDETLKQCGFSLELNQGTTSNLNYEQLLSISKNIINNYFDFHNIDKKNINNELINCFILTKFNSFDKYLDFIKTINIEKNNNKLIHSYYDNIEKGDFQKAYDLKFEPSYTLEKFKNIYSFNNNFEMNVINLKNIGENKYIFNVNIKEENVGTESYETVIKVINGEKLKTISSKKVETINLIEENKKEIGLLEKLLIKIKKIVFNKVEISKKIIDNKELDLNRFTLGGRIQDESYNYINGITVEIKRKDGGKVLLIEPEGGYLHKYEKDRELVFYTSGKICSTVSQKKEILHNGDFLNGEVFLDCLLESGISYELLIKDNEGDVISSFEFKKEKQYYSLLIENGDFTFGVWSLNHAISLNSAQYEQYLELYTEEYFIKYEKVYENGKIIGDTGSMYNDDMMKEFYQKHNIDSVVQKGFLFKCLHPYKKGMKSIGVDVFNTKGVLLQGQILYKGTNNLPYMNLEFHNHNPLYIEFNDGNKMIKKKVTEQKGVGHVIYLDNCSYDISYGIK